ncbi:MAG TPA: hypothetical protein VK196_13465 [Magnetospirillum sp.]|nr:hypothetical protein [Magnetospirillum sp.]
MVAVIGLTQGDEAVLRGLYRRMADDGLPLDGLARVEWRRMDGYNGLVKPARLDDSDRLHCVLYLATAAPFTIAHELAHVADIALRHDETLEHLSGTMSKAWHLAHRMSSEYFANRVATRYCVDAEIFPAFQNDRMGLIKGARDGAWADVLINYAMLLGIFHGLDRLDVEPLELLPDQYLDGLPDSVLDGMAGFRNEADQFFRNCPLAAAA